MKTKPVKPFMRAAILALALCQSSWVGAQEKTAAVAAPPGAKAAKPAPAGESPAAGKGFMKGDFDLVGEKMVIDFDENGNATLVVQRNVKFQSDDIDLECDHLTMDADKNVVAHGTPVKVKQSGFTATCQTLEVFTEENKFILTGNPVLNIIMENQSKKENQPKPIHMLGDKITFFIKKDGKINLILDSKNAKNPARFTNKDLENLNSILKKNKGSAPKAEIVFPDVDAMTPGATPTPAPSSASGKAVPLKGDKKPSGGNNKSPTISQ